MQMDNETLVHVGVGVAESFDIVFQMLYVFVQSEFSHGDQLEIVVCCGPAAGGAFRRGFYHGDIPMLPLRFVQKLCGGVFLLDHAHFVLLPGRVSLAGGQGVVKPRMKEGVLPVFGIA